MMIFCFFFFKQKTAYEMRISDWSSDVCSSDLPRATLGRLGKPTALVRDAHAAGLKVHPWTFRRENYFLPLGDTASINPAGHGDLTGEIDAYLAVWIDGLFSDNPREDVVAVEKGGSA